MSFEELAARAKAAFDRLPSAQQAAHRREQAISWVRGEMRLKYGDALTITEEEIGCMYAAQHPAHIAPQMSIPLGLPNETVYVRATRWRRYRYDPGSRSSELVDGDDA